MSIKLFELINDLDTNTVHDILKYNCSTCCIDMENVKYGKINDKHFMAFEEYSPTQVKRDPLKFDALIRIACTIGNPTTIQWICQHFYGVVYMKSNIEWALLYGNIDTAEYMFARYGKTLELKDLFHRSTIELFLEKTNAMTDADRVKALRWILDKIDDNDNVLDAELLSRVHDFVNFSKN